MYVIAALNHTNILKSEFLEDDWFTMAVAHLYTVTLCREIVLSYLQAYNCSPLQ